MLIREQGLAGLKIHVWYRSMLKNFYKLKTEEERVEIDKHEPIEYFMALARFGLVKINSARRIKNDLRAFIPSKGSTKMDYILCNFRKSLSDQ